MSEKKPPKKVVSEQTLHARRIALLERGVQELKDKLGLQLISDADELKELRRYKEWAMGEQGRLENLVRDACRQLTACQADFDKTREHLHAAQQLYNGLQGEHNELLEKCALNREQGLQYVSPKCPYCDAPSHLAFAGLSVNRTGCHQFVCRLCDKRVGLEIKNFQPHPFIQIVRAVKDEPEPLKERTCDCESGDTSPCAKCSADKQDGTHLVAEVKAGLAARALGEVEEPEPCCPHCKTTNVASSVMEMNVENYGSNSFHVPCLNCGKMICVSLHRGVTVSFVSESDRDKDEADF